MKRNCNQIEKDRAFLETFANTNEWAIDFGQERVQIKALLEAQARVSRHKERQRAAKELKDALKGFTDLNALGDTLTVAGKVFTLTELPK